LLHQFAFVFKHRPAGRIYRKLQRLSHSLLQQLAVLAQVVNLVLLIVAR